MPYIIRTFLGLLKIIQVLYDDLMEIARICMILMVAGEDYLITSRYSWRGAKTKRRVKPKGVPCSPGLTKSCQLDQGRGEGSPVKLVH